LKYPSRSVIKIENGMSKLKCPKCGYDIGPVLAARAGRATSVAKAKAARCNGFKGGWPKGRKRKKQEKAK
jgi:predicted RNA-binding Zn-ribbon protein involved in translation (DUF1610 family)